MVVKFFGNKKGGSGASVDYLLNDREAQGTARTLKGDPQLTKDLIRSIDRKQKVCVGCLSFEEANIPEADKQKLMRDFEEMLLPGLATRYNILWVEHTDKGRLELNFVIPKVELTSGKALNPYYHKADLPRLQAFEQVQNLRNDWTNPLDPDKARTLSIDSKKLHQAQDYERLDKTLHDLVADGQIQNRTQLLELLEASKIDVTRKGQDYISVKLPESKKAQRFKGGIYAEQFRSVESLNAISETATDTATNYRYRSTQRELATALKNLTDHTQYKARELQRQFPRGNSQEHTSKDVVNRELDSSRGIDYNNTGDVVRHQAHDVGSTQRPTVKPRGQTVHNNSGRDVARRHAEQEKALLADRRKLDDIARADATRRARERETAQLFSLKAVKAEPSGIYRRVAENFKGIRERSGEDYRELQSGVVQEQNAIRELHADRSVGIQRIKEQFKEFYDRAKEFVKEQVVERYHSYRSRGMSMSR